MPLKRLRRMLLRKVRRSGTLAEGCEGYNHQHSGNRVLCRSNFTEFWFGPELRFGLHHYSIQSSFVLSLAYLYRGLKIVCRSHINIMFLGSFISI
ncbi:hypothetical protein QVD17_18380 [Tagetes erecta]|uniref:Uncharacterized protein n=1 Tax=Tagetes erecta TaxID=13708 RepID=A0AAD8KL19_TARER|nr:hypothetical protein QVD17_18380 [Tagetes erecta]